MNNNSPVYETNLSPARRRLVHLLRVIHFGRVCHLTVRSGEPVFEPAPTVLHTCKLTAQPDVVRRTASEALGSEVVALLHLLTRLGDGVVERIEIARGIPFIAEVAVPLPPQ